MQAVKTTLVTRTIKRFTGRQKRPSQRGPTEYQKEKRSHKETGLSASNKQEHQAQNCRAKLRVYQG